MYEALIVNRTHQGWKLCVMYLGVEDLEGLGSLGRIYASPSVAIAGTVRRSNSAGPDSRKLLIRWRSLPDSNRCTSLERIRTLAILVRDLES
jgi:hypothetical protein